MGPPLPRIATPERSTSEALHERVIAILAARNGKSNGTVKP